MASFVILETAVRLSGLGAPPEGVPARLVDPRWRELLDCYPSNPRGYFDVDLRDPATRARYHHLAPLRYDAVAKRAPFGVLSRYNRLRFRDQEASPKRPGARRIAVLGDSFVEGQGVKEQDTLVRKLETLLNEGRHPATWEVRNCARRGADFPALIDEFEAALPLDPDVVVYAMVLNDAVRTPEFEARQRYVNDWIMDRGQPDADLPAPGWHRSRLASFVRARIDAWRIGRETTQWYIDMYGPPNRVGWERTRAFIREMQLRTTARGARFVLVLWPLLVDTDSAYPFASAHREVQRFCLAAGIEMVELLPSLRVHPARDLWVHATDMHPNEVAQALAARALAPVVARSAVPMP